MVHWAWLIGIPEEHALPFLNPHIVDAGVAAEVTALWIAGFYWHSWTLGEYVEVADQLFAAAAEIDGAIAAGLISDRSAARSIIFRAQWALQYRPPDVANFVERLEHMLDTPDVEREAKADIVMFFALTDSPLTTGAAAPACRRGVGSILRPVQPRPSTRAPDLGVLGANRRPTGTPGCSMCGGAGCESPSRKPSNTAHRRPFR